MICHFDSGRGVGGSITYIFKQKWWRGCSIFRSWMFDVQYWMLGAGALGRPRGMVWGGTREEGSGWGTRVYLWRIHVDIWQNQYNIVKLKKKKKYSDHGWAGFLVIVGCYNNILRLGGFKNKHLFLSVWRLRSQDQGTGRSSSE